MHFRSDDRMRPVLSSSPPALSEWACEFRGQLVTVRIAYDPVEDAFRAHLYVGRGPGRRKLPLPELFDSPDKAKDAAFEMARGDLLAG